MTLTFLLTSVLLICLSLCLCLDRSSALINKAVKITKMATGIATITAKGNSCVRPNRASYLVSRSVADGVGPS